MNKLAKIIQYLLVTALSGVCMSTASAMNNVVDTCEKPFNPSSPVTRQTIIQAANMDDELVNAMQFSKVAQRLLDLSEFRIPSRQNITDAQIRQRLGDPGEALIAEIVNTLARTTITQADVTAQSRDIIRVDLEPSNDDFRALTDRTPDNSRERQSQADMKQWGADNVGHMKLVAIVNRIDLNQGNDGNRCGETRVVYWHSTKHLSVIMEFGNHQPGKNGAEMCARVKSAWTASSRDARNAGVKNLLLGSGSFIGVVHPDNLADPFGQMRVNADLNGEGADFREFQLLDDGSYAGRTRGFALVPRALAGTLLPDRDARARQDGDTLTNVVRRVDQAIESHSGPYAEGFRNRFEAQVPNVRRLLDLEVRGEALTLVDTRDADVSRRRLPTNRVLNRHMLSHYQSKVGHDNLVDLHGWTGSSDEEENTVRAMGCAGCHGVVQDGGLKLVNNLELPRETRFPMAHLNAHIGRHGALSCFLKEVLPQRAQYMNSL